MVLTALTAMGTVGATTPVAFTPLGPVGVWAPYVGALALLMCAGIMASWAWTEVGVAPSPSRARGAPVRVGQFRWALAVLSALAVGDATMEALVGLDVGAAHLTSGATIVVARTVGTAIIGPVAAWLLLRVRRAFIGGRLTCVEWALIALCLLVPLARLASAVNPASTALTNMAGVVGLTVNAGLLVLAFTTRATHDHPTNAPMIRRWVRVTVVAAVTVTLYPVVYTLYAEHVISADTRQCIYVAIDVCEHGLFALYLAAGLVRATRDSRLDALPSSSLRRPPARPPARL